jgi:hypothetical protein
LKKNGKYFFDDESHTKIIEAIDSVDGSCGRYESKNIFVSLENDINKENQFLFSTASHT